MRCVKPGALWKRIATAAAMILIAGCTAMPLAYNNADLLVRLRSQGRAASEPIPRRKRVWIQARVLLSFQPAPCVKRGRDECERPVRKHGEDLSPSSYRPSNLYGRHR